MTNHAVNAKQESGFSYMTQILYEVYGVVSIKELKKLSPQNFN